ncbi:hypothetical protein KGF56_001379 [Candida oxycetoniae]|uniref:Uncharacterized protein n=1 Tax=Candida oxycetoniae TaxID=497107 RepID=A0AAI9SZA8_9ASCO|nr:uncharacterized protein KGF56_001379 [Candida oxycetoniae]KAI3405772.2 hypothetical protein KGF56_001379 [Candida oxycetoniae]
MSYSRHDKKGFSDVELHTNPNLPSWIISPKEEKAIFERWRKKAFASCDELIKRYIECSNSYKSPLEAMSKCKEANAAIINRVTLKKQTLSSDTIERSEIVEQHSVACYNNIGQHLVAATDDRHYRPERDSGAMTSHNTIKRSDSVACYNNIEQHLVAATDDRHYRPERDSGAMTSHNTIKRSDSVACYNNIEQHLVAATDDRHYRPERDSGAMTSHNTIERSDSVACYNNSEQHFAAATD